MIDFLTWVIVALVFIQPNADRFFIALVFAGLTQCHNVLLGGMDGVPYYWSAVIVDFVVLAATASMPIVTKFNIRIGIICAASIMLNAMGAALWVLYAPPTLYNIAFIGLYGAAIIALIKRDKDDVGDTTVGRWISGFRRHDPKVSSASNRHEKPL